MATEISTVLESINNTNTTDTETVILPSYNSLMIPKTPTYIGGKRSNVNSYGTVDLSGFKGTTQDMIKEIGADFKAIKKPCFRQLCDGSMTEVPNDFYLINDKTDEVIGAHATNRYSVLQFDDSIYFLTGLIEEIKKHGYGVKPAYGKVWNGGSKMFVQYEIEESKIKGEPIKSYISLVSSHDGSCSFTLALSTVRLFCQNQVSRMLKGASNRVNLKHTTSASSKIESIANKMIELEKKQLVTLEAYADSLCKIKIEERDIFDAYGRLMGLDSFDTQRKADNFANRASELIACYRAPDLADFTGTAYGAYLAYADFVNHVVPLRKTQDQRFIEEGLNGNVELGEFIDTLQAMKI